MILKTVKVPLFSVVKKPKDIYFASVYVKQRNM